MATYTIAEYGKMLDKKAQSFIDSKGYGQAVSSVLADVVVRIFEEGKNSNGDFIGNYNTTKPLYVNPTTSSPRGFPTHGKNDSGNKKKTFSIKTREQFKTTTGHKTAWFPSYRAFRKQIGAEARFVNLNLYGLLYSDLRKGLEKRGNKYVWGVKRAFNVGKVEGAEHRFGSKGKIFALTSNEHAKLNRLMAINLVKILS